MTQKSKSLFDVIKVKFTHTFEMPTRHFSGEYTVLLKWFACPLLDDSESF